VGYLHKANNAQLTPTSALLQVHRMVIGDGI
jgi:hypothetical protein